MSSHTNPEPRTPNTGHRSPWPRLVLCTVLLVLLVAWGLKLHFEGARRPAGPELARRSEARPASSAPGVLWVYKAPEHFVASPVPTADALYVTALGAFNTGVLHCLAVGPDARERVLWSKTAPYIKRPTVCAPAVSEGLVVFGDGMHQTDDALLYCLRGATGRPVWQLPVPGKLVHLEASPVIDGGRVYIGGGDAGVLCVDLKRVTLDGKEQDLATAEAFVGIYWADMVAKYQEEKKKDPEFALPPDEDKLPKPAPKLLWQRGQKQWHVDAPLAVDKGRVLVASAYIDEEKVGRRSLLCLNAADGAVLWECELAINPWAGATVAGDRALVACSSIRFDAKQSAGARGEIVAVDLATGAVKWRKEVPGGVLHRVAIKDGLALFAATDGKVRAWDVATGAEKWSYDAAAPLFAGVAVAGDTACAADLKGVVHGLGVADGRPKWTLDIATNPSTQAPGAVYGTPAVGDGRLYVGTCNLEGASAGRPSAVVCISSERSAVHEEPASVIAVDRKKRTVRLPCRIAPRKLPTLKEVYPIEVIATHPSPQGLKAHETIVTFDVRPSDVHKALESLGLKPGSPAKGEECPASGPELRLLLEFAGPGGERLVLPIERALVDAKTGKAMPVIKWHFAGSVMRKPDPDKDTEVYGADLSGTLIAVFPVTDETVILSELTMTDSTLLKLDTDKNLLPPEGAAATLIIAAPAATGGPDAGRPDTVRPETGDRGPRTEPRTPITEHRSPITEHRASLPALVTAPGPSASATIVPVPSGSWLPPARIIDRPRVLPSDLRHPVRERPVSDSPSLPSSVVPGTPLRELPAGPAARVEPAESAPLAVSPGAGVPDPDRADAAADPALDQSRRAVTSVVPDLRRTPAPFLRLAIPDPFEPIADLELHRPPRDAEPPVRVPALPARTVLPAAP